ncbi:MAG TPA: plastocyanin/azurin family copper-binding protein [bacterium]|nr:plastocyanin/azurin family copper-binding protein [bacterium]
MRIPGGWWIAGATLLTASAISAAAVTWRPGMPVAEAQAVPPAPAITIDAFQFKPKELEVKADAKVAWTNDDDVVHTVTSGVPGGRTDLFNASLNGKGARFEFTFARPGVYAYFCNRHQQMRGEITVK